MSWTGKNVGVLGPIIIVLVVVVIIPVSVMMSGSIAAGVLGWLLKSDAEARNEGSELIDLNR